jgi:predicted lipoprotein with Yx(FWY)xxD motif
MSRLFYLAPGLAVVAAFGALGAFAAPQPASKNTNVTEAAPPGITLRVIRIGYGVNPTGSNSNQPRDRIVFADAKGWVLYTSDKDKVPGKSSCYDDCAKTWPPALAPENAKPVGHWTVVPRDDGAKQWAFRGQPLYTYVDEKKSPTPVMSPGAVANTNPQSPNAAPVPAAVAAAAIGNNAGSSPVEGKPKAANSTAEAAAAAAALGRQSGEGRGHEIDGREVVELTPAAWIQMPVGLTSAEVRTAPGHVLTNDKGLPLYTFSGKVTDGMSEEWKPVTASHLALPIGDFTLLTRPDGATQWAYKKQPLYSYVGDLDLGDSNGRYADQRFQLVYFLKYFTPANVVVQKDHIYGGLLATTEGKIIYVRENNNGGVDGALRGDRGKFGIGEKIALTGCDALCETKWKPLLAPDDAQSTGYWSLYDREDGKKQWAYFGYAAYTYDGELKSSEVYDPVDPFEKTADGKPRQNIPMHWRVAPP